MRERDSSSWQSGEDPFAPSDPEAEHKTKQLYETPSRVMSAVVYARDDKGDKAVVCLKRL